MATTVMIPKSSPRIRRGVTGGRAQSPEIYFRKPIDNSRLRREIDWAKSIQCYRLLGFGLAAFAVLLIFSWQHFECVRYGYEIQRLRAKETALKQWNNRLKMESAALSDPERINHLARTELGMIQPQPGQIVPVGGPSLGPHRATEYAGNIGSARAAPGD